MPEQVEVSFVPETEVRQQIEELLGSAEPAPERKAVKVKKNDVLDLIQIQCVGAVERAKKAITRTAAYDEAGDDAYILNEVVDEVRQLLQSEGEGDTYNIEALILKVAKEKYEGRIFRRKVFQGDIRETAVGVVAVGLEDRPENFYMEAAIISEMSDDTIAKLPLLEDVDSESGYRVNIRYAGGKLRYQYFVETFSRNG